MPLAERDANTQHRRSLARGQSSPASGRENTAPSPTVNLAKDAPRHSQRFLAPTKASAAKLSTPPSTERSRLQPHSNRSVPPSQSPASRLPRPGLATPTPPVGKWSVAFNQSTVWAENSASDSSPSLSPSKGENVTGEHSLVRDLNFLQGPNLLADRTRRLHLTPRAKRHTRLVQKSLCLLAPLLLWLVHLVHPGTVAA